jgi:hypothetical protein
MSETPSVKASEATDTDDNASMIRGKTPSGKSSKQP